MHCLNCSSFRFVGLALCMRKRGISNIEHNSRQMFGELTDFLVVTSAGGI